MSYVEIYKLRKTVPEEIREHSVFDLMKKGTAPDPAHYIKEWAGEMHGTLPLTIPGRLMLEPPEGYRGGDIRNGDIAIVDGRPFYFDKLEGSKFIELESFDTSEIRQARYYEYGWFVDVNGANVICDGFANICSDIGVPCGYFGEPKDGDKDSGHRPFLPGPSNGNPLNLLHPQFLNGEEARDFIKLLTELSEAENWARISNFLNKITPLTTQDLQDARQMFAPELLLPAELRPLYKLIPGDVDKAELDYLAAKIRDIVDEERDIFNAVIEAKLHCGSVAELINLTDNLGCFELQPAFDESQYGKFRLENDYNICQEVISRLEKSEDPSERFLAKHITLLTRCAEDEAYGYHAMKDEGGTFTQNGYITQERPLTDIYCGIQDIPAEYRAQADTPAITEQAVKQPLIMVQNTDLAALLLETHAVSGDYMRDARHNIQTLAKVGDDFIVMVNAGMLTVTPVDFLYRRDMHEHEFFMTLSPAPDNATFFLSVANRDGGCITGDLYEMDFWAMRDSIREHSFFFSHLDAEMKDGSSRRFNLEEWDAMDRRDRGELVSWRKYYDPADETKLATLVSAIRWACEDNRQPAAADEFLSKLNEPYMAQANNPKPDMLRVTLEAAKEILAQDAAHVFRLTDKGAEKLSPIDAAKTGLWYSTDREFAIRRGDSAGIEKWAKRSAGDMLRQIERSECDKSESKREEL